MTDFGRWFARFTGCESGPHEWQERLALSPTIQNRLVRVPTGMGKTAGIVAAWAWNRVIRGDQTWPRRLVFCLPMRVLVEQTRAEIQRWLKNNDLLWGPKDDHAGKVGVHLLMGGEDGEDWHLYPEQNAVLIGTQDMLLSRALNRGYGAGRARWPMDFGLLNQDALWVMDEVQLMDVGLATSAQLQAFRHGDQELGKELRPCRTWWMSATLQPSWLQSVDTRTLMATLPPVVEIDSKSRTGGFWDIHKSCKIEAATGESAIAELARSAHQTTTLTLVVLNRVETAKSVHKSLEGLTAETGIELRLVHSRFRPAERSHWREDFLNKGAPMPAAGRIIVTTQVVEAGVDISAHTLITELAPWSSLVQRFGRCARYVGESGVIRVVDRGWNEKSAKEALPYEVSDLDQAKAALGALPDVSLSSLEAFEENLKAEARQALYPYNPRHLLLRREWDELFDTAPDLSGADIDISRFIRSGEELDCHVFWREVPANGPSDDWQPGRTELCPVPFLKARDWLCGPETKEKRSPRLKPKMRAWVWDWVDGEWRRDTQRKDLLPGRTVLVDAACGGYEVTVGWSPEAKEAVPLIAAGLSSAQDRADSAQGREDLSESEWKTIATHGREVATLASELALAIGLGSLAPLFQTAGLWHDVGKAHPCFQGSMRHPARPNRQDLAKAPKAPKTAWARAHLYRSDGEDSEWRPGLRHELGSALALFAALLRSAPNHPALRPRPSGLLIAPVEQAQVLAVAQPHELEVLLQEIDAAAFNLLVYLVASHHGKVRMSLHAAPQDQDYRDADGHGLPIRGIRDCDKLPEILGQGDTVLLPPSTLTLEPALLGLSEQTGPSWTERTLGLLKAHGPGALAFMEAILRAADIRASRLVTADPLLATTDHPSSSGGSKEVAE